MDQQEWLARQFEDHRPHLRAVAYRMLGSLTEADDAVQDAWLRRRAEYAPRTQACAHQRRGRDGARALLFDYRLAPEHTHPAQVDDSTTIYRWLLDHGISPKHIAFTGDSCGGGLAITTQLRARERSLPLPAAAMPFSP
jgi:hypothetical protein